MRVQSPRRGRTREMRYNTYGNGRGERREGQGERCVTVEMLSFLFLFVSVLTSSTGAGTDV